MNNSFEISNRAIIKLFASILIFIFSIYFIYKIQSVLMLIVISGFLALSIYRPVNFIATKLKISRGAGTAIAYVLIVGIVSYLAFVTIPPLIKQVYSLALNAPELIEDAKNSSKLANNLITKLNIESRAESFSAYASANWDNLATGALSKFQSFLGFMSSLIMVLVLTLMMITEGPEILNNIWMLYKDPIKKKKHQKLFKKMYRVITGYMNGQIILTTLNASFALIFIMIASKIAGVTVQYPLALWAMIWLAGLIPLVGATLGAAIAVMFTLFSSWKLSLAILIYYIIYQQIENSTLQPWIQSKSIHASALMIIVAALIGGSFGGLVGAFLAIPAAGCLKVLIDFYIKENYTIQKPNLAKKD